MVASGADIGASEEVEEGAVEAAPELTPPGPEAASDAAGA
jgi:hypothetical protein